MTCETTTLYEGEPTPIADAVVELTGINADCTTAFVDIDLPWGDYRQLSIPIPYDRDYINPDNPTEVWSIRTMECENEGTASVSVECCHGTTEANQILTLYCRPYPWSNNESVATTLISRSSTITGILSASLPTAAYCDYVSHEIVIEKPDFSEIDLVGIRIYVYSESGIQSQAIVTIAVLIFLLISPIIFNIELFGWTLTEIVEHITYKAALLVRECGELHSENVILTIENGCLKVGAGEMTEDEFVAVLRQQVKENEGHRQLISPKNSPDADNVFKIRIEDAIAQYNIDGDFDTLCGTAIYVATTRKDDDKTETENNYSPFDRPSLSKESIDEWLTYLMYGGIAIGGLLAATIAFQLTDKFGGNHR